MFHIKAGTIDETVLCIELIRGVKIDPGIGAAFIEHFPDPFHRSAVKSKIVDIQAVDAYVFDQPVQAFYIKIVPAGNA